MERFHDITGTGEVRHRDRWGFGHFGAGRGGHRHQGVDFVARPNQTILSPIDGYVIRTAAPYRDDASFTGVVIEGAGPWAGVEVKLFYVQTYQSRAISAGEDLGTAQNLAGRYPGITNHVHMEVRLDGRLLSPDEVYQQCL